MPSKQRDDVRYLLSFVAAPICIGVASPQLACQALREQTGAFAREINIVRTAHRLENRVQHALVGQHVRARNAAPEIEMVLVLAHSGGRCDKELAKRAVSRQIGSIGLDDALKVTLLTLGGLVRRRPIAAEQAIVILARITHAKYVGRKVVGAHSKHAPIGPGIGTGAATNYAGAQTVNIVLKLGLHQSTKGTATDEDISSNATSLRTQEVLDKSRALLNGALAQRRKRYCNGSKAGKVRHPRVDKRAARREHRPDNLLPLRLPIDKSEHRIILDSLKPLDVLEARDAAVKARKETRLARASKDIAEKGGIGPSVVGAVDTDEFGVGRKRSDVFPVLEHKPCEKSLSRSRFARNKYGQAVGRIRNGSLELLDIRGKA